MPLMSCHMLMYVRLSIYVTIVPYHGLPPGIELCAKIKKQRRTGFAEFCNKVLGEPLESLMIKPVQRIPRYKMLLEELLKHMPVSETTKRLHLTKALEKVSEAAAHCNQHIGKAMQIAEANALHERFQGKVGNHNN